jgi:hypothetical protein
MGGRGIGKIARAGYAGRWAFKVGSTNFFGWQANFIVIAICFFILSLIFSGKSKENTTTKELKSLQEQVQRQAQQIEDIRKALGK